MLLSSLLLVVLFRKARYAGEAVDAGNLESKVFRNQWKQKKGRLGGTTECSTSKGFRIRRSCCVRGHSKFTPLYGVQAGREPGVPGYVQPRACSHTSARSLSDVAESWTPRTKGPGSGVVMCNGLKLFACSWSSMASGAAQEGVYLQTMTRRSTFIPTHLACKRALPDPTQR